MENFFVQTILFDSLIPVIMLGIPLVALYVYKKNVSKMNDAISLGKKNFIKHYKDKVIALEKWESRKRKMYIFFLCVFILISMICSIYSIYRITINTYYFLPIIVIMTWYLLFFSIVILVFSFTERKNIKTPQDILAHFLMSHIIASILALFFSSIVMRADMYDFRLQIGEVIFHQNYFIDNFTFQLNIFVILVITGTLIPSLKKLYLIFFSDTIASQKKK